MNWRVTGGDATIRPVVRGGIRMKSLRELAMWLRFIKIMRCPWYSGGYFRVSKNLAIEWKKVPVIALGDNNELSTHSL